MIKTLQDLDVIKSAYQREENKFSQRIYICAGAGCVSCDCEKIKNLTSDFIKKNNLQDKIKIYETGCMGMCSIGPVMIVIPEKVFYVGLSEDNIENVLQSHFIDNKVYEKNLFYDSTQKKYIPHYDDIPFFREQTKIVLKNCGAIEYNNIDSYIAKDGYKALYKALSITRAEVVEKVKKSGLRGRGGGGFPTGVKWEAGYKADSDEKYIVCNADEGDPGAFMDRSVIEGDPHNLIEGMAIGAYAIGAKKGYVYIRAEYPIAIKRLEYAIEEARNNGLLGENIFGTDFSFDLEIRIGAGAFVCGEETSLMASIEGKRGEPSQKPPFPFESGLFGKPTIINNVETFANISFILFNGEDGFAKVGCEKAKGTKVFALAGDIVHSGIVEVPIGTSLGHIIYDIGGGIINNKKFKIAQVGGPSGGCITAEHINVPMEYEALINLGAMMGSGGLIVMDEDTCMVDTARFFLDFIQDESCGKCTPCRVGTKKMLEIVERITEGKGREGDIDLLLRLARSIKDSAMCGLGQTAPNPVLSTIRYFRDEYEEHIKEHHCRAGVCSELFVSNCENACPAGINIPNFLGYIASGDYLSAYKVMLRDNPMSAICGRICTHPCEFKCRRSTVDESVSIASLQRFATDWAYSNSYPTKEDLTPIADLDKKIAIIGAGPSGLTCAYYLARLGYKVDVFEARVKNGGMILFGIPEYRLPEKTIEREVEVIKAAGVNIKNNVVVGKDIKLSDLERDYDAIYIGIGAQKAKKLNLPGENLENIFHGIYFLEDVTKKDKEFNFKGLKVAVIGGGNTAIDAARTALRFGADKVDILYRRDIESMPADITEIHDAIEEGIEIKTMLTPKEFIGKDGKLTGIKLSEQIFNGFDKQGRRAISDIEGSDFIAEYDVAIPAISQSIDTSFIDDNQVQFGKDGIISACEKTMKTDKNNIFVGGDARRGPDDIVHAISDAKIAASNIDKFLGGTGNLYKGEDVAINDYHFEGDIVEHNRFLSRQLSAELAKNNFDEVNMGLHQLDAMAEAMRCLRCDRR